MNHLEDTGTGVKATEEMVTIEVPLGTAEVLGGGHTIMVHSSQYHTDHIKIAQAACRKALDARRSPYELWQEKALVPWELDRGNDVVVTDPRYGVRPGISSASSQTPELLQLISAAPQLLDALILFVQRHPNGTSEFAPDACIDAIRAAVPEDVANFLLDKGTK